VALVVDGDVDFLVFSLMSEVSGLINYFLATGIK
jgi:hypothetical protein